MGHMQKPPPIAKYGGKRESACMGCWDEHMDHPHLTKIHARKGTGLLALAVASLLPGIEKQGTLYLYSRKK